MDVRMPSGSLPPWHLLLRRRIHREEVISVDQIRAGRIRSIFQHRIGPVLQDHRCRRAVFAALCGMDEEDMAILDDFAGDVGSHLLEGLVEPDPIVWRDL